MTDLRNFVKMTLMTNPHFPGEPSLHVKGVDTVEQVDTYTAREVRMLSDMFGEALQKMIVKRDMSEPTLWDGLEDTSE